MPHVTAQASFQMFTNLPSDVITNTFHFDNLTPVTLEAAADVLHPMLINFYSAVYANVEMANYIGETRLHVKWYRSDQPPPRIPYETNGLLTGVTLVATSVPTEVAAVLSYHAEYEGGVPRARSRGRIYLGALTDAWIDPSTTSTYPVMDATQMAAVRAAADAFAGNTGEVSLPWSVWSPTDQAIRHIVGGWTDNSPDTQRRRSVDSTSRTNWTITP